MSEMTINGIRGIRWEILHTYPDARGYLCELFRTDQLSPTLWPSMAYVSVSNPGIVRGPHEHKDQTDLFCFLGNFSIYLWDNRPSSPTYRVREVGTLKGDVWTKLIVPPGIVHAYKNVGTAPGMVINFPNRLYNRESPDEIRHEDDPNSPFLLEEK